VRPRLPVDRHLKGRYHRDVNANRGEQDFGLADLTDEAWKPAAELGLLLIDPVFWGFGVRRGDGRPVLVLPGLYGGDRYLGPLRDWLRRIGYSPVPSGLEQNPGWSEPLVNDLGELAETHFRRTGQRVTIIGHSMGGLQGRAVAAHRPRVVRHVIALGSPLTMARSRLPDEVRMTAIYSRGDRIVRHPAAMERDPRATNVEVSGSHIGLTFNPAVYRALASTLPAPDREVI
jgi:pimeloyl-ACP methyl ester carboxylesterase